MKANISEDSPGLDRLALQIVQAREQDLLVRDSGTASEGLVQASTSDGNVWTDLPFLVPDMTKYWLEGRASMSSAQRLSFTKFLASLACAGVGRDDGLCGIALATLRETLETPRALGTSADQQQVEDSSRLEAELSVAAYLPSANAWLSWAGLKIVQLSEQSWNKCFAPIGEPGSLLGDSEPGFCAARWIYWLARLEGLATSFRDAGEDSLAAFATGMMDNMLITIEETGGVLRKDLDAAYANGTLRHRTVAQELV